jgi:hypothetical protein
MNLHRRTLHIAALALVATLALSACKSNQNTQPAASSNPAPPAAAPAPGSTPDAGTAGAGTGPAAAPAQQASQPPAPQAPPPPEVVSLPVGTSIPVRLDTDLGSKISQPGDSFTATVSDDVVSHGQVIIPRGARAEGTVVDAQPLGRFKGGARLEVKLERVHTKYGSYPVSTGSIDRVEQGKGKRSTALIGGGAGLGALIGGLAGGGKGAAIGALAGGGAGTAGSAFTGNKQIILPAETVLTFHLDHPVHITEQR